MEGNTLVVEQDQASISIDELGTVVTTQPAMRAGSEDYQGLPVLIEETIRNRIKHGLLFAAWVLDHIDKPKRLSDVVVVVLSWVQDILAGEPEQSTWQIPTRCPEEWDLPNGKL